VFQSIKTSRSRFLLGCVTRNQCGPPRGSLFGGDRVALLHEIDREMPSAANAHPARSVQHDKSVVFAISIVKINNITETCTHS
jgi:hypothetical protein